MIWRVSEMAERPKRTRITAGLIRELVKNLPDDAPVFYHHYYKGCGLRSYELEDTWLFPVGGPHTALVMNPGDTYDPRQSSRRDRAVVMSESSWILSAISDSDDESIQTAIDASHPVEVEESGGDENMCLLAQDVAEKLVHSRNAKRELVGLVRWLLMGAPKLQQTKRADG